MDAASRLTDGVAAHPGEAWNGPQAVVLGSGSAYVELDLGAERRIGAAWLQADHNDRYVLSVSADGRSFREVWRVPKAAAQGLRDRSNTQLDTKGRYVRLAVDAGDGSYSVSELMLFENATEPWPPSVERRRAPPTDAVVRSKVLVWGLAMGLWLLVASRRFSPWGWALGALLPLAATADALGALHGAWPLGSREVAIVRATMAAVAAFAIAREVFAPARWAVAKPVFWTALATSAALALLAFYNLGRPQFYNHLDDDTTFVHILDLRQYYATAKYFDEIGYTHMFEADIAAYVEDRPGKTLASLSKQPMRRLSDLQMSTVGAEADAIRRVKERFSPERWQAYKADQRWFRRVMTTREYLRYMRDHGGNATPVWIAIARALFNVFDPGEASFLMLALVDPLLLAIAFAAIGRTFGWRSMLVCMVVFGANDFVMFGTNWAGAPLRHDWLAYLGLGVCALASRRWVVAGVFLALSGMIRAFPALAVAALAMPLLWWVWETQRARRRLPSWSELWEYNRGAIRAVSATAVTCAALFVISSAALSMASWWEWLHKVSILNADPHANAIGLRALVAGSHGDQAQVLRSRWPFFASALVAFVAAVVFAARSRREHQAALLGLVLVPVVFLPANYYLHMVYLFPLLTVGPRPLFVAGTAARASHDRIPHPTTARVWLILLGLCVSQYFTVLVEDTGLHFYLATALYFVAITAVLGCMLQHADQPQPAHEDPGRAATRPEPLRT